MTENKQKDLIPVNKDQESINNIAKMSAQDKAILTLVKEHPTLSMYEIGKLLQQQGTSKNSKGVYSNLSYSDCLRLEIDKIHTHNHEYLARKAVPRANKIIVDVLKDKSIDKMDKKAYVDTALKHGLKQDVVSQAPRTVSIEQVNIIQQIVRDNVSDDEVIDGEVIEDG